MSDHEDRHSLAEVVELIDDPDDKARREAENGIRQYNAALEIIKSNIPLVEGQPFRLTQKIILDLHRIALDGIHPLAGTYRNSFISIGHSSHRPPESSEVADLMSEMCSFVNSNWSEYRAIYLAAYLLWRINWIHPFADGNGRTARMVSYVILSIKLNSVLPGAPTIPDQIADDKSPYYAALEKADAGLAYIEPVLVLADMENMLEAMLAKQLLEATRDAAS